MKKFAKSIVILLVIISLIACIFGCGANTVNEKLLRFHVRANSNSSADQAVKLVVRDSVLEYLKGLPECDSFEDAYAAVSNRISEIKAVSDKTLSAEGFGYQASVKLCRENFPARSYDGVYVAEGVYDALIIELGEGSGDNFWCVIYPTLCYGRVTTKYKSYIAEWIKSLKG